MIALTEKELDVLGELECAKRTVPGWKGWLTPMFCGGSDGSHHSATLARLVRSGLVERKRRAGYVRASYFYRITRAGLVIWRNSKPKKH